MPALWLGIDTGTGGTRALLIDRTGKENAACTTPHEDIRMEQPLWAEQRPGNCVSAAGDAIRGVLGANGRDIHGIELSGQMHRLVILDRSAQVIRPSLIWCDQRSQRQVDQSVRSRT
jgi:xylulokinase